MLLLLLLPLQSVRLPHHPALRAAAHGIWLCGSRLPESMPQHTDRVATHLCVCPSQWIYENFAEHGLPCPVTGHPPTMGKGGSGLQYGSAAAAAAAEGQQS